MSINFNIKDRNKKTIYNSSEILNLCYSLEEYYQKNNLNFYVIYGGANSASLLFITTLLLSRCNFAISPESFEKEKINSIFNGKKIKIIDQEYLEGLLKINFFEFNNHSQSDKEIKWKIRLKQSFENSERIIGYFSSGSTGEPKLIPVSSQMSFICHEKVINNFKNKNSIKNIICLHDNSFVISLNYVSLGLMMDISLLCLYDKNPLTFLYYLKKSSKESLLISIPSFWEKISSFLIKKKFKIHSSISCGEPLKWDTAKDIYKSSIHNCFNYYGATEFSTWVFNFSIDDLALEIRPKDEAYVPIGYPLNAVKTIISEEGELGINCKHMIRYYITQGYSLYKADIRKSYNKKEFLFTGDRACIKNKKFYCLGRKDGLVKVKGIFVDLFVIQEKVAIFLEMREFILVISNKQVIHLYINSKDLNDQEKLSIRNEIEKILFNNINEKILRNIIMEDNGLKYNRSSKLDRSYYFKLSSGENLSS